MHFLRRNRFSLLVFLACSGLIGYIVWQGMLGPRSVLYREVLLERLVKSQEMASTLASQRVAMEERVQMLRPETVDADLADEFARKSANLGLENEIVIVFNK